MKTVEIIIDNATPRDYFEIKELLDKLGFKTSDSVSDFVVKLTAERRTAVHRGVAEKKYMRINMKRGRG